MNPIVGKHRDLVNGVIPIKFRMAAMDSVMQVARITSNSSQLLQSVCRYRMADVEDMTAVVTYDNIVRHAAILALPFVVVFNNKLYVPPLTGSAVTTSS